MKKRLKEGDRAPDFEAETFDGKKRVKLIDFRGSPVWLIFYRYASCPLCNLHFSTLLKRIGWQESGNFTVIAIFESKPDQFPKTLGGRPYPKFPILSDHSKQVYKLYGTEERLSAALRPSVGFSLAKAVFSGFPQGSIDGKLGQIPAHFLISEYGIIEKLHYGSTIADHIPWKTAELFLSGHRAGRYKNFDSSSRSG